MKQKMEGKRAMPGGNVIASGDGKVNKKVDARREEMLKNVAIWASQEAVLRDFTKVSGGKSEAKKGSKTRHTGGKRDRFRGRKKGRNTENVAIGTGRRQNLRGG